MARFEGLYHRMWLLVHASLAGALVTMLFDVSKSINGAIAGMMVGFVIAGAIDIGKSP